MKWFLSCLSLALVVSLGVTEDIKTKKVTSKEGKCEIVFPGEAKEQPQPAGMKGEQYVLETMAGKAAYMLQYNLLPGVQSDNKEVVKKIFDGGEMALVAALKGKIVKSDDGTYSAKKYPARDIDMEVETFGIYRVKLILVGDRFYQVTVLGPKDFVNGKEVKAFMDSFKLTD